MADAARTVPVPLSRDTTPEIEATWLEGLRARGPAWRVQRAADLTSFCWRAAMQAFSRARPDATARDRARWLLEHRYGADLARRVMDHCDRVGFDDF